jgi:hypothetical protein
VAAKAMMSILWSTSMPSASVMRALGRSAPLPRNALSKSGGVRPAMARSGRPIACAAALIPFTWRLGAGFAAFQRTAARVVYGAASGRRASHVSLSSGARSAS